jgi:hypothetical protein
LFRVFSFFVLLIHQINGLLVGIRSFYNLIIFLFFPLTVPVGAFAFRTYRRFIRRARKPFMSASITLFFC